MTILIHIVGPQGSGKSSLIQSIVRAAGPQGRIAHVEWEAALGQSNDRIRGSHAAFSIVFVESMELESRHSRLLPGDAVLLFQPDQSLIWREVDGLSIGDVRIIKDLVTAEHPAPVEARDAA